MYKMTGKVLGQGSCAAVDKTSYVRVRLPTTRTDVSLGVTRVVKAFAAQRVATGIDDVLVDAFLETAHTFFEKRVFAKRVDRRRILTTNRIKTVAAMEPKGIRIIRKTSVLAFMRKES